ncbi:glycoside hydrolase family 16 protein [Poriferisphaera sp. WC338]|uniref:glycoside hydrolase family 16 protein n=1 Tax=Poriferisphaera sp. WC338 TaxID=3425129 RepID=UPI003D81B6A4
MRSMGLDGLLVIGAVLGMNGGVWGSPPSDDYVLTWGDEFNGNALDLTKWQYTQEGKKRHDATITRDAVSVKNGLMEIRAWSEYNDPNDILKPTKHYTGIVGTRSEFLEKRDPNATETFAPVFGYMEARIKFTQRRGTWGAFWLQSPTYGKDKTDHAGSGMEIDVIEHRGTKRSNTSLHWGSYGNADHHVWGNDLSDAWINPDDGQFHTLGMEWTDDHLKFYYDGVHRLTFDDPAVVPDVKEAIYFSLTVNEDSSFGGKLPSYGLSYKNNDPFNAYVQVDYFRYYSQVVPEPSADILLMGLGSLFLRRRCVRG